jgi:hypothetical protein
VTLPDATGVTTPTLLLILTDVAFVVVHDKVADEPLVMLVGLTARVTVGSVAVTVTVAVAVAEPLLPVAVAV